MSLEYQFNPIMKVFKKTFFTFAKPLMMAY